VEALMAVDVGSEAPAELYAALAEVLVWVYRANAAAR
jgi:type III secretion system FlhB-like substrate exporter